MIGHFGLEPSWKTACRLNQQKFAVAIHDTYPEIRVPFRHLPQKINDNPFIFNRVTEIGTTTKVGEICQELDYK